MDDSIISLLSAYRNKRTNANIRLFDDQKLFNKEAVDFKIKVMCQLQEALIKILEDIPSDKLDENMCNEGINRIREGGHIIADSFVSAKILNNTNDYEKDI